MKASPAADEELRRRMRLALEEEPSAATVRVLAQSFFVRSRPNPGLAPVTDLALLRARR